MTLIRLIGQYSHYIDDGEVPFFLLLIPRCADTLVLK